MAADRDGFRATVGLVAQYDIAISTDDVRQEFRDERLGIVAGQPATPAHVPRMCAG